MTYAAIIPAQTRTQPHWLASCRYCGAVVVRTPRVSDHDVHALQQHLRHCRPELSGSVYGAMSVVRKHFQVDTISI